MSGMGGMADLYPLRSGTGECSTPTKCDEEMATMLGTPSTEKTLWKSGVMPSRPRPQTAVVGPVRRLMIAFVLVACGAILALAFTLFHSSGHEKVRLRGEVERLKSRSDILTKHFNLAKQEKHDLARMILDTKSREALGNLLERSAAFDKFVQKYGFTATPSNTKNVRKCLEDAVNKFNITSMLDVPCGDGSWQHLIPSVKDRRVTYIGGDINIKALEKAKMNEDNKASRMEYFLFDSVHFPLRRPFDLILFRDVIEHLQIDDALTSLLNFKESQSTYVAMTYWPKTGKDANKAAYLLEKDEVAWYEANLLLPPFNFPQPLVSCENDDDGPHVGKSILGIWKLSDLPITKESILNAEREQVAQRERVAAEKKKAKREKRVVVSGPCGKAKQDMMSLPFNVRHEKYDCGIDPRHGGCTDECPCYDPGNEDQGPWCFHLSEEHKGMHLLNQMEKAQKNLGIQAPSPPELAKFDNPEADEMDKLKDMALQFTRDFKNGTNRSSLSENDFADAIAHLFANQQRDQPFDGLFNPYLSTPRGSNGQWGPEPVPQPTAHVLQRGPDGQMRPVGVMHGNKILQQGPDGEVRHVGTVHGDKILQQGPDGQMRQIGNVDNVQGPPGFQGVPAFDGVQGPPGFIQGPNGQWVPAPVPQPTKHVLQRGPDGQMRPVGVMHGNKILQQGPDGEVRHVGTVHGNKILQQGPDGQVRHVGNVGNMQDIPRPPEQWTSGPQPQAHLLQRGPDGQVKHVGTMQGNKILKKGPDGQVRQVGLMHGNKILTQGPDGEVRHVGNVGNIPGPPGDNDLPPFQDDDYDNNVFGMPDFAQLHGLGNGYGPQFGPPQFGPPQFGPQQFGPPGPPQFNSPQRMSNGDKRIFEEYANR